jgi:hypothetical protein
LKPKTNLQRLEKLVEIIANLFSINNMGSGPYWGIRLFIDPTSPNSIHAS